MKTQPLTSNYSSIKFGEWLLDQMLSGKLEPDGHDRWFYNDSEFSTSELYDDFENSLKNKVK